MNDLRIAGWSGILFSVLSLIREPLMATSRWLLGRPVAFAFPRRSAPAEQRSECKCTLGASFRAGRGSRGP